MFWNIQTNQLVTKLPRNIKKDSMKIRFGQKSGDLKTKGRSKEFYSEQNTTLRI